MKQFTPFEIAKLEMAKNVKEFQGNDHSERILLYGCAVSNDITDDETPWCSSFMNFCVIMSNLTKNFSIQEAHLWQHLNQRKCQLLIQAFEKDFKPDLDQSIDTGVKIQFPTYSAGAISWENHIEKTDKFEPGTLLVKKRGTGNDWKRHVCFVDTEKGDSVLCLGGNQGNKVGVSLYSKNEITFLGKF
jgi:hypothetical protein